MLNQTKVSISHWPSERGKVTSINEKFNKRWLELNEASNELSIHQVRKDIKKSGKKSTFFLLGYTHTKIPEEVYKDKSKKK